MRKESNRNPRILIFKTSITKIKKPQQMVFAANLIQVDIERISELKVDQKKLPRRKQKETKMIDSTKMRRI